MTTVWTSSRSDMPATMASVVRGSPPWPSRLGPGVGYEGGPPQRRPVDVYVAAVDFADRADRTGNVGGENACRQAVAGVVGLRYRLFPVLRGADGNRRAEQLLPAER